MVGIKDEQIYLDYAAATPVSEKVLAAMLPYFGERFFNPAAPYQLAREVREEYRAAKRRIAQAIGVKAEELVMTAGATEAINLGFTVVGAGDRASGERKKEEVGAARTVEGGAEAEGAGGARAEGAGGAEGVGILVGGAEHAATRAAAEAAARVAGTTVAEIKLDRGGGLNLEDLQAKLGPKTEMVAIALADSELGVIQPIGAVAEILRAERERRAAVGERRPLWLQVDASQAMALVEVKAARMGIDLLILNAGKIFGPKGVGALYVTRGAKIRPLIRGGGQERGYRSGTENVAGTVGMAVAISEAKRHLKSNQKRYRELKQYFKKLLQAEWAERAEKMGAERAKSVERAEGVEKIGVEGVEKIEKIGAERAERAVETGVEGERGMEWGAEGVGKWPELKFLGNEKSQLASFVPISIAGIEAERLVFHLERQGIMVSTGAACAASKGEKSYTLAAIGLSEAEIQGSLRIVMGAETNQKGLARTVKALGEAVAIEVERKSQRGVDQKTV